MSIKTFVFSLSIFLKLNLISFYAIHVYISKSVGFYTISYLNLLFISGLSFITSILINIINYSS